MGNKSIHTHLFFEQVRNITNLSNAVNVKLLGRVLRSCSAINTLQIQNTIFLNGLHNFCPQNSKLHTIRVKSNKYLEITDRKLEIITGLQDLQLQGVKLYNDRGLIRVFLNNEQTLTVLKLDIWKNPFDGEYNMQLSGNNKYSISESVAQKCTRIFCTLSYCSD